MRRLYAWVVGATGGLAAYRLLRRRGGAAAGEASVGDPRADELRAKLAQARDEPAVDTAPEPEAMDVEARRRSVHDQGRAAIEQMRGDAGSPEG
jgi:hypothetical protein